MNASPTTPTSAPLERWRQAIAERAVPDHVRERAPEGSPGLEPSRFRWRPENDARHPDRPSRRRALEALPEGGSVIDVGAGGGGSSLGLAGKAGLITAVDRMPAMLESFLASGQEAGVAVRAVEGTWPDVAGEVEPADIVVSHNTIYGLVDIEPFVAALTGHARHRVVLEVAFHPPQSHLAPLWKRFHGIDRPVHRVADDAEAVLRDLGLAVEREDAVVSWRDQDVTPEAVAFARRRLYVGADRDPEIAEFLRTEVPRQRTVAALWWPGTA
jgi:SAM-dependent methyltransferase